MLSVEELFRRADLNLRGPKQWGDQIDDLGPGVYVVTVPTDLDEATALNHLCDEERQHWMASQHIIYIGRSKHLRRRLREFYKHKYGEKRPHRGGQAVTLLKCRRWVYWSAVAEYSGAEHRLIEIFKTEVGRLPFGNRVRSARLGTKVITDRVP